MDRTYYICFKTLRGTKKFDGKIGDGHVMGRFCGVMETPPQILGT